MVATVFFRLLNH